MGLCCIKPGRAGGYYQVLLSLFWLKLMERPWKIGEDEKLRGVDLLAQTGIENTRYVTQK